ncbi:MAG: subclass B1 metallo-beta-lactamase [Cyclobacteriaceae bacterium]
MYRFIFSFTLSLSFLLFGFKSQDSFLYQSEDLFIEKLTEKVFIHKSYLQTESFGKVGCNGMVYFNGSEAIVFDTPIDDKASLELIEYLEKQLKLTVIGVVVTHFHEDCLGGLQAFHQKGIPSYANKLTLKLAKDAGYNIPQNGFTKKLELTVSDEKVVNAFLGAGHTRDNIVSYIPSEAVLFGGCLLKCIGAKEGYLGDAVASKWPKTMEKIEQQFPEIKHIVPGHGPSGDIGLLKYTAELFTKYNSEQRNN